MAELKWTSKDITKLLNAYRKYDCLWNPSNPEYIKRKARDIAFDKLIQELNVAGLNVTLEPLKKKIKSIRDTYRNEVNRIKKSKRIGTGAKNIYKPKLVWFSAADSFLNFGSGGENKSSSKPDIAALFYSSDNDDAIIEDEDVPKKDPLTLFMSDLEDVESSYSTSIRKGATNQKRLHAFSQGDKESMDPTLAAISDREDVKSSHSTSIRKDAPNQKRKHTSHGEKRSMTPAPVTRSAKLNQVPNHRFESAADRPCGMTAPLTTTGYGEDQYNQFGKHIAAQLRELPLRNFLLLQDKIQRLVTAERLSLINPKTDRSSSKKTTSSSLNNNNHTDGLQNESGNRSLTYCNSSDSEISLF